MDSAVGIVAGPPKVKKSFLVMYLAYQIAKGEEFLGRKITRPGPVLMVQEEDPERVIYERLKQLSSKGSSDLHLLVPSRTGWHVKMTDPDAMERLESYIQEIRPVLLTLDPLSNIYGGLSENDASEVARVLDRLRHWRDRYHCSILIVHHTRKQGEGTETEGYRLRGSSVLYAKVESLWLLEEITSVNLRLHSIQKAGEARKLELVFHNGRFDLLEEMLNGHETSGAEGREERKAADSSEAASVAGEAVDGEVPVSGVAV
jgi:predicted ATP-dependent serine protease